MNLSRHSPRSLADRHRCLRHRPRRGRAAGPSPRGTVARRAVRGQVDDQGHGGLELLGRSALRPELHAAQRRADRNAGPERGAQLQRSPLVATDQHHGNVTGTGVALPQTDIFGYFSLPTITSNPSNPEVFVKILDGRTINGSYWVFYGHLTDLIYDITVKENATGTIEDVPRRTRATEPGGFDTAAFPAAALTTPGAEGRRRRRCSPNSVPADGGRHHEQHDDRRRHRRASSTATRTGGCLLRAARPQCDVSLGH